MIKQIFTIIMAVFLLQACDNEVVLEGEWKDIPIVYGFISTSDTAHYIRIEKAYLEQGGDALEIAQIADSIYYNNLNVSLKRTETGQEYILEKVDGNLEGYVKEEGVFANDPNYLYKIKASDINLEGEEEIELLIERENPNLDVINAKTVMLSPFVFNNNAPANPMTTGEDERTVTVRWSVGEEAKVFDLSMIFYYAESIDGTNWMNKSITWNITDRIENPEGFSQVKYDFKSKEFYQFIGNNIDIDATKQRKFIDFTFKVSGAGQELLDYLDISDANLGLTGANQTPTYTNISEGRGIFTSRNVQTRTGMGLTAVSLDSLYNGRFTRALNFVE